MAESVARILDEDFWLLDLAVRGLLILERAVSSMVGQV